MHHVLDGLVGSASGDPGEHPLEHGAGRGWKVAAEHDLRVESADLCDVGRGAIRGAHDSSLAVIEVSAAVLSCWSVWRMDSTSSR